MGWCCRSIYGVTTLRGMTWGADLSNIITRDLTAAVWEFQSVTSRISSTGFCRE